MQNKPRPKYLNLLALGPKMSITAKVSILHRITGFLLFLSVPFVLFLLHQSLTSSDAYSAFYLTMSCPLAKLIYLGLIFIFVYHMLAGIRFLCLDVHKGVDIKKAKFTARFVLGVSVLITVGLGALIW